MLNYFTLTKKVETQNTGGNVMVDLVFLKSGKIIGITDDSIALYESLEDWENSDVTDLMITRDY